MAFDETFQQLPRLTEEELYRIPEINFGEIRPFKGLIKLEKVQTSPIIEFRVRKHIKAGGSAVVKLSHDLRVEGYPHSVAWLQTEDEHRAVCDCVADYPDLSMPDEILFACEGFSKAVNIQANSVRRVLSNDIYMDRLGDYETVRAMTYFILNYAQKHSDVWLASHQGGVVLAGGLAQTLKRSYDETKEMLETMQGEGLVRLNGPGEQVVTLAKAA